MKTKLITSLFILIFLGVGFKLHSLNWLAKTHGADLPFPGLNTPVFMVLWQVGFFGFFCLAMLFAKQVRKESVKKNEGLIPAFVYWPLSFITAIMIMGIVIMGSYLIPWSP